MKRLLTSAAMILCSLLTFAQFTGTQTDAQGVKYTANDDGTTCYVSRSSYGSTIIIIPEVYEGLTVTSIGGFAFDCCRGLTSITIPNSVTSIGDQAFRDCSGLTSITIPNSVTSIGYGAFAMCSGLTSIIVDGDNIYYDSRDNCNAIIETASNTLIAGFKTTVIPNSVTSIGDCAFAFSGLTSITIPNSVTSIGDWAFDGCSGLTSITIPNSVTSIGENVFYRCSGLTSIIVNGDNNCYDSRDNCNAIIETASNTLIAGCKNTIISNSVTNIGDRAFDGCSGLTSITIPNSVTSIGDWAFDGCSGLTSITIPNSVTSIGDFAFFSCSGLTSVTIMNETPIANMPSGSLDAFYDVDKDHITLYVPAGSKATYKVDNYWRKFKHIKELFTGTQTDAQGVIYTAIDGESSCYVSGHSSEYNSTIVIPDVYEGLNVTSIGEQAFINCSNLTTVVIPKSVKSIDNEAFKGCVNLNSVVTRNIEPLTIGANCFENYSGATLYVPAGCEAAYQAANYWNNFNIMGLFTETQTDLQGVKYTANNDGNTCYVSGHSDEYSATIAIPAVFEGRIVTSIRRYAFSGCSLLTSITIPNSVTSIGDYAFHRCSGLTSVTIPNSVTSIGEYAFELCSGLTSVTIPNSVTSIGRGAFHGSFGLTSIIVDVDNIYYDSRDNSNAIIETASNTLIAGCKATVIPNSVTSIGDQAFWDCSGLTSITIPNSVTSIGDRAFAFSGLTSITIPNSVTSIGDWAFGSCSGLTSVTIPNSVTSIGEGAFQFCSGLTSVTIPNSVTSIGRGAFGSCSGLTSVTIPNSVTSIGEGAFQFCSGLTSVTIPNSVTSIGRGAFHGSFGLTSIIVDVDNIYYDSRDNCNAIIETASNTLIAGCKNTIISNSVTNIGYYAFWRCEGLTSIVIPHSVTKIGEGAFSGCSGLTSISIPNSVTSIGRSAFSSCSELTSITIPSSVTSIGKYAFERCNSLVDVIVGAVTPIAIDDLCFSNCANATLYVPTGSKAAYQAAQYWQDFKEIIEMPEVSQMDNAIYLDYPEAYIGGTVPLYVKMKNTMTPNGCSFMLTLPAGMSLAKDAGGDVIYTLADRANKMNVTILDHNDGTYDLALMPATSTATITGNENTIVKLMLQIPDNISTGDYIMHLTKSLIQSETNNNTMDYPQSDMVTLLTVNDYRMGDVNGDDGITPSDAIMTLYYYFNVAQTGFNAKAADVTGDGKVTPADAIEMLYKFFGIDRSDNSRRRAQQVMDQELDPQ